MRRSLAIAVLFVVAAPLSARAQATDSLPRNEPVRIMRTSMPGIWQEGRIQAWPEGGMVLRLSPTESTTIPLTDLARFQTRTGTRGHTGAGALVGGLVGLGAGLAWVALADPDANETVRAVAVLTYFTLPGAGLGALVGSRIRSSAWEDAPLPREPWHDPGASLRAANR